MKYHLISIIWITAVSFCIGQEGRVGIGTEDPLARLHIKDSSVLFEGTLNMISPAPLPVEGAGTRLMWYPDKAAFRVGHASGNQWNQDSIGYSSVALGNGPVAAGNNSFACGDGAKAYGPGSFASGNGTEALGKWSTAMGGGTRAESFLSHAIGRFNIGGGHSSLWLETDPLFEIGIGYNENDPFNALTVLKNGRVGIGTHSPTSTLHVKGQIRVENIKADDSDGLRFATDDGFARLTIADNGFVGVGTQNPASKLDVDGLLKANALGANTSFPFCLETESGIASLCITNNANVGIGISAPSSKLHVYGDITVNNTLRANNSSGLDLATDDGTTRLRIADNGFVGIGTSSPNRELHVLGETRIESNTGGAQVILDGSSGLNEVEFQQNGAYRASIGYDHTAGRIFLYHGGNVFVKSGNLGVGTTPSHKIDVSGGAYCDGSTWTNSSSRELKENFIQLNARDVLDKICMLEVSQWNYKEDPRKVPHIGPMAEDFHAAFGIGQDDKSISTVDVSGVTMLAVQAQQQEIRALQGTVEKLIDRIEFLEKENEIIKKKLDEL